MQRISKGLGEIRDHYTVVVVGSGYGGGVAASRLSRAGQDVCLLERGREILPGEYPDGLQDMKDDVQIDTSLGRYGSRTGMFDFRMNDDVNALVGCGLGGTSLINANVALEIDADLFEADHWPQAFKRKGLLDEYYERARQVLGSTPYPEGSPPLNKLAALEKSAKAMGKNFYRPPINVNFEEQVNAFGVPQQSCANCGDCVTGCNYGAKNTTLMNYLPDAHNHGAEIFTLASVRSVERTGDRWTLHIESMDAHVPDTSVTADVVVLAAGTLGSTEILIRSRERGLSVSPQLGKHFSGNGDVLGFGYNNFWNTRPGKDGTTEYDEVYGVGAGGNKLKPEQLPGPCIAGIIDMRDEANIDDRLVIEEGVIPGALATVVPPIFFFSDAEFGDFLQYGAGEASARLTQAQALAESIQKDPGSLSSHAYEGPVGRTQTYLVMSHDHAAGELQLKNDRLRIEWPGAGKSPVIANDNEQLKAANDAIHGQFIPNALWSEPFGYQLMTVHPVGGCRMADSWDGGVVDDACQVFSADDDTRHEGLFVCDGSVIPGAVGVNPLLTISALTERACDMLAEARGWSIDFGMREPEVVEDPGPPQRLDAHARDAAGVETGIQALADAHKAEHEGFFKKLLHGAEHIAGGLGRKALEEMADHMPGTVSPGFAFTETMEGWFSAHPGNNDAPSWERISDEFELACGHARAAGHSMSFKLTIASDDVSTLISDPTHPASVTGHVTADALSHHAMEVTDGHFELLPVDPSRIETWNMVYSLVLQRKDGDPVHFRGMKYLHQTKGSSPWTDLTTLYVTVYDGDPDQGAATLGRGILTLDLKDLLRQGSTLDLEVRHSIIAKHSILTRGFEWIFLGKLAGWLGMLGLHSYGGLLADLYDFPAKESAARARRPLSAPSKQDIPFETPGGTKLRLTRYRGGERGPVVLAPGFSVSASSFAIDTVDENIVEYLTKRKFDVWLFDYRASPHSGSATTKFDIDDIALEDWPAAIARIRKETGAESVQAVCHCVGSMSLLMAMLSGTQGVRAMLSSQLTLHPVSNWLNDLKADTGLLDLIRTVDLSKEGVDLHDKIDLCSSDAQSSKLIDTVCWKVPVPEGEACTNPVCRRVNAIFGPSYAHAQLNHATHIAMCEMFGEISIHPFDQLAEIIRRGISVDRDGANRYLPHVERLALPITFFAGSANQIFFPETSRRTYEWLVAHNGPGHYTRQVFEGYAHMDFWVGKNAARDIYPSVLEFLEKTA